MINIKPHQILSIPDNFPEEIKFFMPSASGVGGLRTLESVMLIKLLRLVSPQFIFEFGTYKGETTRLLLENLPEIAAAPNFLEERIYTLDLSNINNIEFEGLDKVVAEKSIDFKRKYLTSTKNYLVKQILKDSIELDTKNFKKKFQYIFIDANHALSYVKKDTENSMEMLSEEPSCIIWHDYGNPDHPELTNYLNELSLNMKLYHIKNTMLVFYILGVDVPIHLS